MVDAGDAARPFDLCASIDCAETNVSCKNTLTLEISGVQKWARETPVSEAQLSAFSIAPEVWEASSQWASLSAELVALAGQHRIENIVCSALGSSFLQTKYDAGNLNARFAYHQHLVACSMAKLLGERVPPFKGSSKPKPLEIVAYDPVYTREDLHLLAQCPQPITVVSDPCHYPAITPETLVISIHHPANISIFDIIADILYHSGPAALLCSEIRGDKKWNKEGPVCNFELWKTRVGVMIDSYKMKNLGELDLGTSSPRDIQRLGLAGVSGAVLTEVGEARRNGESPRTGGTWRLIEIENHQNFTCRIFVSDVAVDNLML